MSNREMGERRNIPLLRDDIFGHTDFKMFGCEFIKKGRGSDP